MKHTKSLVAGLVVLAATIVFASCSTVALKVMRPGEANLRGVKVIAVGDITGASRSSYRTDMSDRITNALMDSRYFEKVVDRQNLESLAREQRLTLAGLTDENMAANVGKLISATNILFGRVQDEYDEKLSQEQVQRKDANTGAVYYVTQYTRRGEFTLSLTVRIINSSTGEMVASKTLSSRESRVTSAIDAYPDAIDHVALYNRCAQEIINSLMRYLLPHQVTVYVQLMEDREMPMVKNVIRFMEAGETDSALELLSEASAADYANPKVKAKALYNHGIILAYAGQFDEGIALLQQAMKLDPANDQISEGLRIARKEKSDAAKVAEQLSK